MKKFGFGETFRNWIKILYSSPMSAVKTNGSTSAYFPLYKGTRQGCCLSPYLFDLAIEPLAIAIRGDERIKGITRGNTIHKTALYADDLLLFVSNPSQCIPHLLQLLQEFGSLSGYKLNLSKSLLFPINDVSKLLDYDAFPFKIEHQSFKYLGVQVTSSFKSLKNTNFFREVVLPSCLASRPHK